LCAYRNNKTGLAFPMTSTLAEDVGKCVRAIQKDLKILVALGHAIEMGFTAFGVRIFFIPLEQIPEESTSVNAAHTEHGH
jgi:hypothetical protein